MAEKTRKLLVVMTADERALKAQTLAEKLQTINIVKLEAKEKADDYRGRLKVLDLETCELSEEVRTGKEAREVDIRETPNVEARTWEVIRCDTGEIVDSRTMTPAEIREAKQFKLVLLDEHKATKKSKGDGVEA